MTSDSYSVAYEAGFGSTVRFLLSKGVDSEQAAEIAQAAWVRGWEAQHQIRDPDRVLSWVNSIAFRKLCNEKRRLHRHEELIEDRHGYASLAGCAAKIDAERLVSHCSSLDRSLLAHHYSSGFDMRETGTRHGLSCVATRVRIHRAQAALRQYVFGQGRGEGKGARRSGMGRPAAEGLAVSV